MSRLQTPDQLLEVSLNGEPIPYAANNFIELGYFKIRRPQRDSNTQPSDLGSDTHHFVTESTLCGKAMLFSLALNTFRLKRSAKYMHRKRNIYVLSKE